MNCLEFRRLQLADPQHLPEHAHTHLAECAACQAFAAHQHDTEQAIQQTLNEVQIPEGLNERILLRSQFQTRRTWQRWPIAAGIVLGLVATFMWPTLRGDMSLARAALAHVAEEPHTMQARQTVSQASLSDALSSVGARLSGDIGQVTYLGSCALPGGEGKHLVVNSTFGRFSLILMPRQATSRNTAEQGMHAAIAKPAARGTYAIVASATPDIVQIEKLLDQNILWSSPQ